MGAKIRTSVLAGPRNDTGKDMLSVYHKQNQAKWPGKGQARAVDGAVTNAEKQMESAWGWQFPRRNGTERKADGKESNPGEQKCTQGEGMSHIQGQIKERMMRNMIKRLIRSHEERHGWAGQRPTEHPFLEG